MKNIEIAILFGSRAEGRAVAGSDVDIAVLGKKPLNLENKITIAKWVSRKYKVPQEDVDVVDIRRAPPLLQFEIAKKGKLIYGKKANFMTFQMRAWKVYQDTARFRRIREDHLKEAYV